MTERLADINARIEGVRQLGAVVNAMKGIAAARARTARAQLDAVDSYAATIAAAISSVLASGAMPSEETAGADRGEPGLLVFCAEQGFAGAFTERVLDSVVEDLGAATLFLIGTRGLSIARSRGIAPAWSAAMPSHTPGVPKLADAIAKALYRGADSGGVDRLDVVFTQWRSGRAVVARRTLLPLDRCALPPVKGTPPLKQLPARRLIESLGADFLHAQICKAALHAFAAENEACMAAMTAAGAQICRERDSVEAMLRRVRQEAITAEIIELGAGVSEVIG